MGVDIKSPQSTTSNMSTHSTQSNHSTISTDSTGYGWTCCFYLPDPLSVFFSHSFFFLHARCCFFAIARRCNQSYNFFISYSIDFTHSSYVWFDCFQVLCAVSRIVYHYCSTRRLSLETSMSHISFNSFDDNSFRHFTMPASFCIAVLTLTFTLIKWCLFF